MTVRFRQVIAARGVGKAPESLVPRSRGSDSLLPSERRVLVHSWIWGLPFLLGGLPWAVAAADLFFSEYVEGSSNNKALELYNPSNNSIDLGSEDYRVELYSNGSPTITQSFLLSGTVDAGGVFVMAHSSADAYILGIADMTDALLNFNGNDALVLRKGGPSGSITDSIGQVGVDPGLYWGDPNTIATQNSTLRRDGAICHGDPIADDVFDPGAEWVAFGLDVFDGLGWHSCGTEICGTEIGDIHNEAFGVDETVRCTANDAFLGPNVDLTDNAVVSLHAPGAHLEGPIAVAAGSELRVRWPFDPSDTYTVDYCRLEFPLTVDEIEGTEVDVFARLYVAGITDQTTSNDLVPGVVVGFVGYGPDGSDPGLDSNWKWVVGFGNSSYGGANEDEYVAVLTVPTPGVYDYAFRFTGDGGATFTYCDATLAAVRTDTVPRMRAS